MKQLVISIISIGILFGLWSGFYAFSSGLAGSLIENIQEEIIPLIEEEKYDEGEILLEGAAYDIEKLLKWCEFFHGSDEVKDIRCTLLKSQRFVHAKDDSNSSGELAALCEELDYLNRSQLPSLENIF